MIATSCMMFDGSPDVWIASTNIKGGMAVDELNGGPTHLASWGGTLVVGLVR